eukprot:1159055-Pelagomonas_calceolata.AAC.5
MWQYLRWRLRAKPANVSVHAHTEAVRGWHLYGMGGPPPPLVAVCTMPSPRAPSPSCTPSPTENLDVYTPRAGALPVLPAHPCGRCAGLLRQGPEHPGRDPAGYTSYDWHLPHRAHHRPHHRHRVHPLLCGCRSRPVHRLLHHASECMGAAFIL